MQIELLYWEGCPSHPKALSELREQMAELAIDEQVLVRKVESDEQAQAERFIGSPTIRIDGVDVVDPGSAPPALNCRVYRRRDGRYSPTPDPEDLRAALSAALARRPA